MGTSSRRLVRALGDKKSEGMQKIIAGFWLVFLDR